jgi:hypothetical protein
MSTTIVTTEENTAGGLLIGGSLLVTNTGACIDSSGAGLNYEAGSASPVSLTIDGLVYGAADGIDLIGDNGSSEIFVNGSVQAGENGIYLSDDAADGGSGTPTISIGTQGTVDGDNVGILCGSANGEVINNAGVINGAYMAIDTTAWGTGAIEITNSGLIQGEIDIYSGGGSTIVNSGTITGLVNVNGTLTNTGTIEEGVQVSAGNLLNSGIII